MKILSEPSNEIHLNELNNGQIAIITRWPSLNYKNRIVQRQDNQLISLGMKDNWPTIFLNKTDALDECFVRILPKGTVIEI